MEEKSKIGKLNWKSILLIILLISLTFYFILSNPKCDDVCKYEAIFMDLEFNKTKCDKLIDEKLTDKCLKRINFLDISADAVNNDYVNACDKLNNESENIKCKDNYYLIKAMVTRDKTFCELVSREDLKDEC